MEVRHIVIHPRLLRANRLLLGSALVGLATMLITLPLPGWITRHIQGAQREKMKRVSHPPLPDQKRLLMVHYPD